MNRVQELIDENKHNMPDQLAKDLLDACMEEYEQGRLFRVTLTRVQAVPYTEDVGDAIEAAVKMVASKQHLIVQELDRHVCGNAYTHLNDGKLSHGWRDWRLPTTLARGDDELLVVHSIEPFSADKRRRT